MRLNARVPDMPALLPPLKLKFNCAVVQLANETVAVPTATVDGGGIVG